LEAFNLFFQVVPDVCSIPGLSLKKYFAMATKEKPREVKGTAEIFHTTSPTGLIHHVGIKYKIHPDNPDFGMATKFAFMSNRNVHKLRDQCRGTLCVIGFDGRLRLAIVVKAHPSTLECTFLMQKLPQTPAYVLQTPTFWSIENFHGVNINDCFLLQTFNLKNIFCRPVNQIFGDRIKIIHNTL
jgi:hypothetical protein